jgi:hypothetical protein
MIPSNVTSLWRDGAKSTGVPIMTAPSVDAETLAAYFHPLRPETWNDPMLGPILRHLAETAPEVIAAVADVDRSLIFDALTMSIEQRMAQSMHRAAFIEAMRETK